MKDITENFENLYHPKSALVIYQKDSNPADTYVEYFDMDSNGTPINAHPLSVREASQLAKALHIAREDKEPSLQSAGITSTHILQINVSKGRVLWFTKPMKRKLYFSENLGITNGRASVPPLLWVANRNSLCVYALCTTVRPTEKTQLYNAPFFNIYQDGRVCMGSVDVRIKRASTPEEFTTAWEDFFFNSYFSHLMQGYNPIKGNCVSLWEELIATGGAFPKTVLIKSDQTIKNLLR